MSGAHKSVQDKVIHDYLAALLLEVEDEIETPPLVSEPTHSLLQVKVVKADLPSLPHDEPKSDIASVVGLENLVAQVALAPPVIKTITPTDIVQEQAVDLLPAVKAEPVESAIPEWAEQRFQCLLFKVSGLSLAVPLVKLNSVISWDADKITETPNETSWYLGLIQHLKKQVKVIDTALLVMPENRRHTIDMTSLNRLGNILLVDDYKWGLACDCIGDVIWLTKDDIKWRKNKQTRPWLSGTSLEHLCAVIDTEVFARMLTESH